MLNRKARYEYNILEEFNAGIVLVGSEVKSLREGKGSINEAYCLMMNGELFIRNMHIDPYDKALVAHEPKRDRKLLLKKQELNRISDLMIDKSTAIIPLSVDIKNLVKVKIGIGKGKKLYDKRQSLKEKDLKREMKNIE